MRETIMKDWTFMRWLRLIMGAFIVFNSFSDKNYLFAIIGALFIFQAFTNTGCAACANVPKKNITQTDTENIEFEEIKPAK